MSHPTVQFQRLHESAILPKRQSIGAAGFDLYGQTNHYCPDSGFFTVDTGIAAAIPRGYVGLIWPRSGLAVKEGVDTGAGVIDADYRGEIKVLLFAHGAGLSVKAGDRIAQLVIVPCVTQAEEVDALPGTERDQDGFGSTGR